MMDDIEQFIVAAKKACYVGSGCQAPSSRPGSHDYRYSEAALSYVDSYFGGTNFCGQEVVWHQDEPVWSMVYFGCILQAQLLSAEQAGQVIKAALSELYLTQNRFLGGATFRHQYGDYIDENFGDYRNFKGLERILRNGVEAYELTYCGGLIKP